MQLGRLDDSVEASEVLYKRNRLSSIFKGRGPLKGLTFDEEVAFLPSIIGINPKSEKWTEAVQAYWANISLDVPFNYVNGKDEGGVELEVGFVYQNQKDADVGRAEEEAEWAKYQARRNAGQFYEMKFTKRCELGTPISVTDFILYRFALVHSHVANTPEEVGNSMKIRFYLESDIQRREKEVQQHQFNVGLMQSYITLLSDRDKVDAVIAVTSSSRERVGRKTGKRYDLRTDIDKDLYLKDYMEAFPQNFMAFVDDKRLKVKAFIHKAIENGVLRELPNTGIIMYGDDVLVGNNIEEACDFIALDSNKGTVKEIKARIDALTK